MLGIHIYQNLVRYMLFAFIKDLIIDAQVQAQL